MLRLKNNKLPKLHLLLNGYKLQNKTKTTTAYMKTIPALDEYNYAMYYFIHVILYKDDNTSIIEVHRKKYSQSQKEYLYRKFTQDIAMTLIYKYDFGLVEYLEEVKE